MDFSVIEGHRSVEKQQEYYHADPPKTNLDGINQKSNHNYDPSLALDAIPYPPVVNGVDVWDDHRRFCVLAGLMYAAAAEEGISLRWGGDWDGDGNNEDADLDDMPHWELLL